MPDTTTLPLQWRMSRTAPTKSAPSLAPRPTIAWASVPAAPAVRALAEFGIVFLMFSIGLASSLPQLKSMRRAVFGLGLAQVTITTLGAMLALHLLGYGWQAGFALGGALAMSSTAI